MFSFPTVNNGRCSMANWHFFNHHALMQFKPSAHDVVRAVILTYKVSYSDNDAGNL